MRFLAIACVVLRIATVHAGPSEDVAVAGRDAALITALGDALAPLNVIAVEDEPPTSIGELAAASRLVAERENTRSAIWLITDGGITTLVAYDRGADRVLVRAVPYATPLSEGHAAVTARSARAMLRALRVDEEAEAMAKAPIVIAPPAPVPPTDHLATVTGLAVRLGSPGDDASAELSIGAIWRPRSFGLVVEVALAPASDLRGTRFEGTIGDRSACLAARLPLIVSPRTRFTAFGGVAVHGVRFAGATAMQTIVDWRFDPAVRIGAIASYAVTPSVDLGLSLSTDNLLRRQRYEVEGEEVIVMPRLQLATGVTVTVRVL